MVGPMHINMNGVGAMMHVAGSLLIVYGQTVVKVSHCIVESSMAGNSWTLQGHGGGQYHHGRSLSGSLVSPPVSGGGPGGMNGFHGSQSVNGPRWKRPDGRWKRQYMGAKMYSLLGWTLFGIGNLMRFVSMRFASQTVLSGLGSLQFVVIPVASKQLLGIQPEISTAIGVGVVLVGNVFILMNGPPEVGFTPLELRGQWSTPEMKKFLLGIGCTMAMLHVLWRWIHHRRRVAEAAQRSAVQRLRRKSREQFFVDGKELFPGGTAIWDIPGSNETDLIEDPGDPSTLRMFTAALLFSAVSSFVGAWSVLFSKSLTYIAGAMPYSLYDWYTWLIVMSFIISAGFWIRQSDKGLKLYPATLIMPLMQAFWLGMSVLQGMIYFDEMKNLPQRSLVLLTLGLVLAIFGAVAMGLSGYFNEHRMQQQSSIQPKNSGDLDLEIQETLQKVSSIDRLNSPALREVTKPNSLSDLLQQEVSLLSSRKNSNTLMG